MSYTENLFTEPIKAGYDLEARFTVTDTDGNPVNISAFTGFRLIGKKRASHTTAQAVFDLALGTGLTVADAGAGVVDSVIPGSATAGLTERKYRLPTDFYGTIMGLDRLLMSRIVTVIPSAGKSTP